MICKCGKAIVRVLEEEDILSSAELAMRYLLKYNPVWRNFTHQQ